MAELAWYDSGLTRAVAAGTIALALLTSGIQIGLLRAEITTQRRDIKRLEAGVDAARHDIRALELYIRDLHTASPVTSSRRSRD